MNKNREREKHYRRTARYYTNLAILKKLRASVHLENKSDEVFWGKMFRHCFPEEHFHFISYSKNPHGNNTAGSSQCLAYRKFLNPKFVICIDSDYRYLFEEEGIDIGRFIFQTYTYSFENHLCFSSGLLQVCYTMCRKEDYFYDFERFFRDYSTTLYPLFIRHIALYRRNRRDFPIKEFWQAIHIPFQYLSGEADPFLQELRQKVATKLEEVEKLYPGIDVADEERRLQTLGVGKENTYLYIRGHNLMTLTGQLVKSVCHRILNRERDKLAGNPRALQRLFRRGVTFHDAITQNIRFGNYPEIEKIEQDMRRYKNYR